MATLKLRSYKNRTLILTSTAMGIKGSSKIPSGATIPSDHIKALE